MTMNKKKIDMKNNKFIKKIKSIKVQKLLKSAKKNLKSKKAITIVALVAVLVILAVSFNLNRFTFGNRDVAATVNGEKITMDELEEKYNFFFFLTGYPESYKEVITQESFLNQLVNEELLVQEAAKTKVSVLDKEVEAEVDTIIESSPIDAEEFEIQLVTAGFSLKDLTDYYKKQMIIEELLSEVFSDLEISDEEVEDYYADNSDNYNSPDGAIRLSHILVETEEEAEDVLTQLKKGTDFAELAVEVSTGPSGVNGGDLGFVSKGQMVPEFEEAGFKLNVNQLSGVVETQFGFHVIKRESGIVSFKDAKSSIVETLKTEKQKELLADYIEELKTEAEIVINLGTTVETVQEVEVSGGEGCESDYGVSDNTIIFYHADWCPHCQKMIPIVEELEEEGYDFHIAETTSGEGVDVVDACLNDILQGGVPQFICTGSKEYKMGSMTKEALKAFVDSC